ncbi:hypothetical protein ON010_g4189 [Phytophthora cinnamomi]|nr:hypothetical protein ON010_g4189 [Phytophthora cinnamomi]
MQQLPLLQPLRASDAPPAFSFPDFTTSITSSGVFELEEEDKVAILEALNAYTGHFQPDEALEDAFESAGVDQPVVRISETPKALKLCEKRAKANKSRTRHRLRVKEEWEALKLQRVQLTAKLEVLESSHIPSGDCVDKFDWQSRVSHEREARLEAEGQQRVLQSAIERSTAVIEQLQELLDRHKCTNRPQKRGGKSLRWGAQRFQA